MRSMQDSCRLSLQAIASWLSMLLNRPRPLLQLFSATALALCFAGCTDEATQAQPQPEAVQVQREADSRETLIRQSESESKRKQPEAAAKTLRRLLVNDPQDAEVLYRLANIEAELGRLSEAVALLASIPGDHPQAGIPALGQSADWCVQLGRLDEAEAKYNELVKRMPDEALPHRMLASLLNRQGRRHEAAEHVKQLCRQGDVKQEELNSLFSLSDAVCFPSDNSQSDDKNQTPIGPMGMARFCFTERRYADAIELMRPILKEATSVKPSWLAFYGRSLAETQDQKEFLTWLAMTDDRTRECAEYWAAVGTYLLDDNRTKEAIRALGEALRRDPTDIRSARRMYQALLAENQTEAADRWSMRFQDLKETTVLSKRVSDSKGQDADAFTEMTKLLQELGRPLEAVMWNWLGCYYANAGQSAFASLKAKQSSLSSSKLAFGDEDSHLCGLKLESYPLPDIQVEAAIASQPSRSSSENRPVYQSAFENVASKIGLRHTYYTAVEPKDRGFPIYQTFGGGCAVMDVDHDGQCDLYWAQGSADPPGFKTSRSDILYRQTDGRLVDVTQAAGLDDARYTLGVTAGDWNQDGFPDLVVANIGINYLWINNGDGTFASQALDDVDDYTLLSTSLAMADIDGDNLPDLFEVNYIHDATIAKLPKILPGGKADIVAPLDFTPAMDRVQFNDGQGGRMAQPVSSDPEQRGTGLGVVVCNFDDRPGNEVFVGNDVRRDQLWRYTGERRFENVASIMGCALGNEGTFTASMGIATGDFDGSHTIDLFITNFENETSSLFLNRGRMFQERSVLYRLAAASMPLVGFGTQAIDYDNDGDLDLVVTNGHVENTGVAGQPFQQPAQLFINRGDFFELQQPTDPSGYMARSHVGRALAVLDYDRDGMTDWIVSHVNEPSALLINKTDTMNHWLRLRLVGTHCERDAIGTRVDITIDSDIITRWLTAGDGYLAHNESVVTVGLAESQNVQRVEVTWPNGTQQRWNNVAADRSLLVVEGKDDFYEESFSRSELK